MDFLPGNLPGPIDAHGKGRKRQRGGQEQIVFRKERLQFLPKDMASVYGAHVIDGTGLEANFS